MCVGGGVGERHEKNVSLRDHLKDVELIDFPGCLHSRRGGRRQNTLNCVIVLRAPLHYSHPSVGGGGRGGALDQRRSSSLPTDWRSTTQSSEGRGPGTRNKVLMWPREMVADDVVPWLGPMCWMEEGYLMLDLW